MALELFSEPTRAWLEVTFTHRGPDRRVAAIADGNYTLVCIPPESANRGLRSVAS